MLVANMLVKYVSCLLNYGQFVTIYQDLKFHLIPFLNVFKIIIVKIKILNYNDFITIPQFIRRTLELFVRNF